MGRRRFQLGDEEGWLVEESEESSGMVAAEKEATPFGLFSVSEVGKWNWRTFTPFRLSSSFVHSFNFLLSHQLYKTLGWILVPHFWPTANWRTFAICVPIWNRHQNTAEQLIYSSAIQTTWPFFKVSPVLSLPNCCYSWTPAHVKEHLLLSCGRHPCLPLDNEPVSWLWIFRN